MNQLDICRGLFGADQAGISLGDGAIIGIVLAFGGGDEEEDLIDLILVLQKNGCDRPRSFVVNLDPVVVADEGE